MSEEYNAINKWTFINNIIVITVLNALLLTTPLAVLEQNCKEKKIGGMGIAISLYMEGQIFTGPRAFCTWSRGGK